MKTILKSLLLLVIVTLYAVQVHGLVNCPAQADYLPCNCADLGDDTIWLDCGNAQLGDYRVSQMLKLFINRPDISPLSGVYLAYNKLTRIPDEISQLNQLHTVYLHGNDLYAIQSTAFNFSPTLKVLYLGSNSLDNIEPGAFSGNYGYGSAITLIGNRLARLESSVFQSLLKKIQPFAPDNARVLLDKNPIDCVEDPCHLAWLVRDNPILLNAVPDAQCANGTSLKNLNPATLCYKLETFVCPTAGGIFADPSSCASYYQCSNNIAYKFDCPNGLVFNPATGRCDFAANVPSCRT